MTTPATVLPATRAMDSRRLEEVAESDSSLGARPKLPLQPIAVHPPATTEKGPRGRAAADGEVDQVVVGDDQQQHGVVAGGGVEAPAGGDGVRKGGDEGAHVRGRAARPTGGGADVCWLLFHFTRGFVATDATVVGTQRCQQNKKTQMARYFMIQTWQ